MADKKITDLDAHTGALVNTDLLEFVRDPGGTPLSEKGTLANLLTLIRSVAGEYTKTQNFNGTTLTSSSNSIAWDAESNQVVSHTATENTTIAAPTNLKDGATYIFTWKQHASAPKTLAFNAVFKFPGGTAPTVTATNNAVDILTFVCDGTNLYGVSQLNFS